MPHTMLIQPNHTILILDASTPSLFVGILNQHKWLNCITEETSPIDFVIKGIKQCLQSTHLSLSDLDALIYCSGPGSTLGLRICQSFVQTIHTQAVNIDLPTYTYSSLMLASIMLSTPQHTIIVAPTSDKQWETLSYSNQAPHPTITLNHELPEEPFYFLPMKKRNTALPASAICIDYFPTKHPDAFYNQSLLNIVPKDYTNTFKKWTSLPL